MSGERCGLPGAHPGFCRPVRHSNTLQVELDCTQGNAQACSQIQFNPNYYLNGNIVPAGAPGALSGAAAWQAGVDNATSLTGYAFNGAFYDEKGVDISLSYTRRLPDNSTVAIRALTTWTDTLGLAWRAASACPSKSVGARGNRCGRQSGWFIIDDVVYTVGSESSSPEAWPRRMAPRVPACNGAGILFSTRTIE